MKNAVKIYLTALFLLLITNNGLTTESAYREHLFLLKCPTGILYKKVKKSVFTDQGKELLQKLKKTAVAYSPLMSNRPANYSKAIFLVGHLTDKL